MTKDIISNLSTNSQSTNSQCFKLLTNNKKISSLYNSWKVNKLTDLTAQHDFVKSVISRNSNNFINYNNK